MRALIAILVAGCGFRGPGGATGAHDAPGGGDDAPVGGDDAPGGDAPNPQPDAMASDAAHDSSVTFPDAANTFCFGRGQFAVCLPSAPIATFHPSANLDINTSTVSSTNCMAIVANRCVIAGTTVMIDSAITITAHGAFPLVFVASGEIAVAGTIDVSSNATQDGPAHDTGTCNAPSGPGDSDSGAGAGAGGSFGSNGGNGGNGQVGGGGNHGGAVATPTSLRGGCAGGTGADGQPVNGSDGLGGFGGGALGLYASGDIAVSGNLDASGAGGHGGKQAKAGGGGGGSGGLIVLDAPALSISGRIYANGGGGGAGAGASANGTAGQSTTIGAGVTSVAPGGPAVGGSGAGNGAAGAAGSTPGGNGGNGNNAGGGAGGGGLGYVLTSVAVSGTSPAAIVLP